MIKNKKLSHWCNEAINPQISFQQKHLISRWHAEHGGNGDGFFILFQNEEEINFVIQEILRLEYDEQK